MNQPFFEAKTYKKVDVVYFDELRGGNTILYWTSRTSFGSRERIKEVGEIWSRIWSIGSTPQHIISAFEFANDGKTKPGQSQRQISLPRFKV